MLVHQRVHVLNETDGDLFFLSTTTWVFWVNTGNKGRQTADGFFVTTEFQATGINKPLHSRYLCLVSCIQYLGISTVHIRYVSMSVFVPQHESSLSEVVSVNFSEKTATYPLVISCYHWFMMVCPSKILQSLKWNRATSCGGFRFVIWPQLYHPFMGCKPHWDFPCFPVWGLMIPQRRGIAANARPPYRRICDSQHRFGFVWKCWVNLPNEIAI